MRGTQASVLWRHAGLHVGRCTHREVLDVGFRLLDQLAQRLRLLARGTLNSACMQVAKYNRLRKEGDGGTQAVTARASSLSEKRSEVRIEVSGDLTYSARRVEGMLVA